VRFTRRFALDPLNPRRENAQERHKSWRQVFARSFAAAGHPYACLGVDTDNATGAVTLYPRLGYVQTHRTTYFGFALDP